MHFFLKENAIFSKGKGNFFQRKRQFFPKETVFFFLKEKPFFSKGKGILLHRKRPFFFQRKTFFLKAKVIFLKEKDIFSKEKIHRFHIIIGAGKEPCIVVC
mgnify:CR=1 FL=1